MITRAITASRPIDYNTDETRSVQSMITDNIIAQKSEQNTSAGSQRQTQTTSVSLNTITNGTETNECISPTEVTRISIATSFALIPGKIMPLHFSTETH